MPSREAESIPLGKIAERVGARLLGDPKLPISGIASIQDAGPNEITFLANSKYAKALLTTRAAAVLLEKETRGIRPAQLLVDQPYYAFSRAVALFFPERRPSPAVHPQAAIAEGVRLGAEVYIGPFVCLERGAVIGDRVVLHPGVYVGEGSEIGDESLIYPNVTVREGVRIGKRVIVHSGSVIGSDGFGFATHGGRHHKIQQVGGVVIGDDVEIGANVTIDRAALGATRIGRGTKIDNLVQVAHNVIVGEDCLIAAQTGISGSTEIGRQVVLAGQVGIVGHVKIGDGVTAAAQAGIIHDLPARQVVWGTPAIPHREALRAYASLPQLPRMRKDLTRLAGQIKEIAKKLKLKGKGRKEEV